MPVSVNGMGNVATEDVVNLFESMGVPTGIDLAAVRAAGAGFAGLVGMPLAVARGAQRNTGRPRHPRPQPAGECVVTEPSRNRPP